MSNWREVDTYVKQWIKEAGERIRQSFQTQLNIETKSNRNDLVTNVDQETEQFFIERIRKTYPEHRILGEEGFGDELKDMKGTIWIIDPIDGTMNFVHQQRNFAISIGIYQDGEGLLGYIYDVVHDELYHARKGHGAFVNETKLPQLEEVDVRDSIIGVNALWVTDNKKIDREVLGPLVRDVRGTRSYGSAAMEMAYVASGRIDGYMTMRLAPWDFAAGKIIIEEVGGVVTSLDGGKLNMLEKSSVFSCKPGLHRNIIETYLKDVKLKK
ncbi:inositol monophosphatase family protein [Rossellomorea vietnamensis]|uniref:inositol-phosphate phosphatase n=2 Tax=Rossellomorea TaxID=2837508 RepID=A0A5D4KKA0_9BACI|nr:MULTISPECIES: inositol monophosphatase family protein [Rossellomorea]TYR77672.1 inositol monophosphatase family protein [Rossellomorea vietnamensis]TYS77096.1 inositol monophosphatase family protein [Rossellomorea aquimaris]